VEGSRSFWPLLGLVAVDVADLVAVGVVCYLLMAAWLSGSNGQRLVAATVLSAVFFWRTYTFGFDIILRPSLKAARLVRLEDGEARTLYRRMSVVAAAILALHALVQILIVMGTPSDAVAAAQVLTSLLVLGLFLWASWQSRQAAGKWFAQLVGSSAAANLELALARHWLVIAFPVFFLLCATEIYGAIGQHFAVSAGLILTINLLTGLILFETLLSFIVHRLAGPAGAQTLTGPRPAEAIARCARVAAIVVVAVAIVETWVVDVIGLVDNGEWRSITHSGLAAGAALFGAYVCWEMIHFFTDSYIARNSPAAIGPVEDDGTPPPTATRLATILPLLRMAAIITTFVVAALIVLSEVGINTTPLIAAVSIFGLALSFGSQTLVHDIVSGIFFLADDAFRVGEYIDCGKAKGTVEGFTLRSVRLRHQNGQIYTIPFGQLGQVTNFSRDWSTIKFNLRFARDTDVEKLRKTTKKVGLEMMEEPEFKGEFLQPLKLQGVADVAENALIMRFKFTAKPNMPTFIQREAMKRLFRAFQAAGIEFANATVSVQTISGRADGATAAAGAAAVAALAQGAAARTRG